MEAETTIKYPFGETPEEVIRDRFGAIDRDGSHWIDGIDNTDELLTVLDALLLDSESLVSRSSMGNLPVEYNPNLDSYNLRISILAALGIDES